MQALIFMLELIGTVAFAISGAMTALKKNMDIFGVAILGLTTAVGGGALRDVLHALYFRQAYLRLRVDCRRNPLRRFARLARRGGIGHHRCFGSHYYTPARRTLQVEFTT